MYVRGILTLSCLGADKIQGELGTTAFEGFFLRCCSWQWILSASRISAGLKVSLHVTCMLVP